MSTVWQIGTITYTNPKLGISFEYPKVFKVNDKQPSLKNDPRSFSMAINSPVEIEDLGGLNMLNEVDVWDAFTKNSMYIILNQYDNSSHQTLDDYLNTQQYGLPYPSSPQEPLINFMKKQSLVTSSVPVPGSYIFTGAYWENEVKEYYFINKSNSKIYDISLYGKGNAGTIFSKDAEKVFDQIVSSIKFTQ